MLWKGLSKDFKPSVIKGKYYIYALMLDEYSIPIYIGKGSGSRAKGHLWSGSAASKALGNVLKKNPIYWICILTASDNEEVIYQLEESYVNKFGKKIDGGYLLNFSDGGKNFSSHSKTEDFRNKKSKDYTEKYGKAFFINGFIFPSKRGAAKALSTDRNHINYLIKINCAFEIAEDWKEKESLYLSYLETEMAAYQTFLARKKRNNGRQRKVVVGNKIYNSLTEAAIENGVTHRAIGLRIKHGNLKETYYLEDF